jgi:RHS repeat-associated protein
MKKVLVNLITCLVYLVCVGSVVPASAGVAEDTITYFHNDLSGSPIVATNAAGNVVWKENYRPYGERLVSFAPDESILFAGKKSDKVTGLSYMGARYYDPVTARFMGVDPVGVDLENLHSFNRYAYANNNPYKYVDPDGRAGQLIVVGMGILVIGGAYYAIAPPSQQQGMRDSLGRLMRAIGSALQSESSALADKGNAEPDKGTDNGGKDGAQVEAPVPGATEGEKTGGGTRTWTKPGGFDEANKDFDKLNPANVGDKGNGVRVGTLEDGRRVIVRPNSSDGRPTIEIQRPDGKRAGDKIRYD